MVTGGEGDGGLSDERADRGRQTPPIVIMGVSGSGKTTVGRAVSSLLDRRFVDADDHHPPANIAKMSAGGVLDDEDRRPWLAGLNRLLREAAAHGEPVVLACSALKRRYRHRLLDGIPGAVVVHLEVPVQEIRRRLARRRDHFAPASIVASQFAALETPIDGEAVLVDGTGPVPEVVDRVMRAIGRS